MAKRQRHPGVFKCDQTEQIGGAMPDCVCVGVGLLKTFTSDLHQKRRAIGGSPQRRLLASPIDLGPHWTTRIRNSQRPGNGRGGASRSGVRALCTGVPPAEPQLWGIEMMWEVPWKQVEGLWVQNMRDGYSRCWVCPERIAKEKVRGRSRGEESA